jgi:hypothetical protein
LRRVIASIIYRSGHISAILASYIISLLISDIVSNLYRLSVAMYLLSELGTRFFYASRLRFRALGRSSSRSFLGLKFHAFAFALSRSLIYHSLFSRSSIFRACTFALLYFRAYYFVLMRLYTARTGQPGQDTQNRTARTGQAEQNRLNRTGITGQAEQERQNRTG